MEKKFPAAQLSRIVDRRMVGKKQLPVVSISPSVWILSVCVGCVVCGEFCDVLCVCVCVSPAVRYVRLFVNAQSEKRKSGYRSCCCMDNNNQCNYSHLT